MFVGPAAIIVPFDGFFALTAAARAAALHTALERHAALPVELHSLLEDALAARTFAEAARVLLDPAARARDVTAGDPLPVATDPVDETLLDLIALDASRAYARELAQGILIEPDAAEWIERQRLRSARVVARSDSAREQVQTILAMSGVGALFSFVRCSDDAPRAIDRSSVDASWRAIDHRLHGASIPIARRNAVEVVPHAALAAAPFVATVHAHTFSS